MGEILHKMLQPMERIGKIFVALNSHITVQPSPSSILRTTSSPNVILYPLNTNSPLFPPPAPDNHNSTDYEFDYPRNLT